MLVFYMTDSDARGIHTIDAVGRRVHVWRETCSAVKTRRHLVKQAHRIYLRHELRPADCVYGLGYISPEPRRSQLLRAMLTRAAISSLCLALVSCGGGTSGSNPATLEAIGITPTNPSEQIGTTVQLVAIGTYSDETTQNVSTFATWTSANTAAATVGATGLVSAIATGTSNVTALLDGVTGQTIVSVRPPPVETTLYTFGTTASDGQGPFGLLLGRDGDFYGTTNSGGENTCLGQANSCGTVYKITLAGVETVLHSFGATGDGFYPEAALIQGSDGNFYGTTNGGGAYGRGTVFRITPSGAETVLYSFGASPSDAADPATPLIQASDGNFYGVTAGGGQNTCSNTRNSCGTVFKITPTGVETVVHSFSDSALDGFHPQGPLIQGSDGNLYGTTFSGGAHSCVASVPGCGTVFVITLAGAEAILHSFGGSPSDGFGPTGNVIQATDGSIYGTTTNGGTGICSPEALHGCGTVFKVTPDGLESRVYSFLGDPSDGVGPFFLMQGGDGNFYGTTSRGGSGSGGGCCGVVFQVTPAGAETILFSFDRPYSPIGSYPGDLTQAPDGNFYGVAGGGSQNAGIIFKLAP